MEPTDQEIRAWARNNGYQVGERGRLQENVKAAYYRAFGLMCGDCGQVNFNGHREWCWLYGKGGNVETVTAEVVEAFPSEKVCPACGTSAAWRWTDQHGEFCDKCEENRDDVTTAQIAQMVPVPASNPVDASFSALVAQIAAATVSATPAAIDETRVREIALDTAVELLADVQRPQEFHIHHPERATITLDEVVHSAFEECLETLLAGDNLFLVGPPGTGKTTLTKQLAKALGVERRFISCSPDMSTTRLAGYRDAYGKYVSTGCRDAFEFGKLFLLDEGDKGNPGILAWTHTALENGECEFPDAIVDRHENNYWCVAANTYGRGATRNYVGSNKMDDAFIDRFAFTELNIDEKLEETLTLAGIPNDRAMGMKWLTQVREWRGNAERHNLSFLITPRASIKGARLLARGMSWDKVAEKRVWKGLDTATRAQIEGK